MLVVAVGANSQAGVIKALASGADGIKSWVVIDGSANVSNGSVDVKYNPLKETLTKYVSASSKVRIAGVEYTVAEKGLDRTKFAIDRPYGKKRDLINNKCPFLNVTIDSYHNS